MKDVLPFPPGAAGFNHRLESLRGMAAMMVALGHAFLIVDGRPWPGVLHVCNGHAAVRLFFVLSGYVLGLALHRMDLRPARGMSIFAVRRLLRIMPAFVGATLLVAGALCIVDPGAGTGNAAASAWFKQFYGDRLTIAGLRDNLLFESTSLNCVTWTLRVEILGSLALGMAHFLARRWPGWGKGIVLAGLMALAWRFPQGSLLPYLFMFWLGYLLPVLGTRLAAFTYNRSWLSLVILLAGLAVFLRSHQTRVELWAEPIGATALLASLVYGPPLGVYRVLDHGLARFYGRISYSFYLLHFPALYALGSVLFAVAPAAALLKCPNLCAVALGVGSVVAVTPLAWVLYVGAEKPGIRVSKRLEDWFRRVALSSAGGRVVSSPELAFGNGSQAHFSVDAGALPAVRPSVLFINRVYPPAEGATGQLLAQLAPALVEAGWQVTVLTSQAGASGGAVHRAEVAGVEVEWERALPFRPGCHWQRLLSLLALYPALLLRALLLERPDVIVVLTDPPLAVVLGAILRWFTGARLVHWAQDLYPEVAEELGVLRQGSVAARLLRAFSSAALRRCERVIAVGECMRGRLAARGVEPHRVHVIPNWSLLPPAAAAGEDGEVFRREHGLSGRFVIMYSGNFGLAHEFDVILDAAERLRSSRPSLVFVMAGDGPQRTRVAAAVEQRHLTNVRLLPVQPQERLFQSLAAADLHLASMRRELCGLVVPSKVYGIVGAGRPCIFLGPRESEAAGLIERLGCGEVLASADGEALASCLARWAADPERLAGAAARCGAARGVVSLAAAARAFGDVLKRATGRNITPIPEVFGLDPLAAGANGIGDSLASGG